MLRQQSNQKLLEGVSTLPPRSGDGLVPPNVNRARKGAGGRVRGQLTHQGLPVALAKVFSSKPDGGMHKAEIRRETRNVARLARHGERAKREVRL